MSGAGHLLIFVYGLNLDGEVFLSRCARPERIAAARLPGHRLDFFGHAEQWDGGEESLVADAGEDAYGIVYRLSFSDLDRLDYWMGVRLDGRGAYFHYPADVIGEDGAVYPVLFHKKDILGASTRPSAECLARIVAGARALGLPSEYVARLAAIPAKPASYPVPCFPQPAESAWAAGSCSC